MSLPDIVIPSLRPQLLGAPFPGTELPDLPTALAEVQTWIDAAEVADGPDASHWIAWPDRPEFQPIYGPVSLNTGAAGIAWYSLAAADATGDGSARRAGGARCPVRGGRLAGPHRGCLAQRAGYRPRPLRRPVRHRVGVRGAGRPLSGASRHGRRAPGRGPCPHRSDRRSCVRLDRRQRAPGRRRHRDHPRRRRTAAG